MIDFDLGRQYDAITCLFSAIAYAKTEANLNATLENHRTPSAARRRGRR